jgi:hypothetical protein
MNFEFANFIGVFKEAFPEKWCSSVIDSFRDYSEMGLTQSRKVSENAISLRKDDTALFNHDVPARSLLGVKYKELSDVFWGKIFPEYASEYSGISNLSGSYMSSIKLQETKVGQGYHIWHCEQTNIETASRIMAFILYLNNVEHGGETEFLYQHKRVSPETGTFVLFPAYYTHTHRGNPPLSNDKYVLTGWIELT